MLNLRCFRLYFRADSAEGDALYHAHSSWGGACWLGTMR